jgi:hypothetical protein
VIPKRARQKLILTIKKLYGYRHREHSAAVLFQRAHVRDRALVHLRQKSENHINTADRGFGGADGVWNSDGINAFKDLMG